MRKHDRRSIAFLAADSMIALLGPRGGQHSCSPDGQP